MSSNREFDLMLFKTILKRDKMASLTVVSDSMSNLIRVGEQIEIQYLEDHHSLKPFDIILFEQAGKLNCHFLAKVDQLNNLYVTKSLKNPEVNDYPLESAQILGIVKGKKISFIRKLSLLIRS